MLINVIKIKVQYKNTTIKFKKLTIFTIEIRKELGNKISVNEHMIICNQKFPKKVKDYFPHTQSSAEKTGGYNIMICFFCIGE